MALRIDSSPDGLPASKQHRRTALVGLDAALLRLPPDVGFEGPLNAFRVAAAAGRLPDPVAFARAVRPLREEGFALAVDDFGAGFSNVPLLAELAPDFIKLDASLVTGARVHPRKRVVLEALAQLGRRLNGTVVAEGLGETEGAGAGSLLHAGFTGPSWNPSSREKTLPGGGLP